MSKRDIRWRVPSGVEPTELDKMVMYYQNHGHLVPTRELIKTPEQIEGIRQSGIINTGVLDLVAKVLTMKLSDYYRYLDGNHYEISK